MKKRKSRMSRWDTEKLRLPIDTQRCSPEDELMCTSSVSFDHLKKIILKIASLVVQMVKNLSSMLETQVQSLGWQDPLEKGMATHSSILAWRIPWTEEPGRLQSLGLQRVRQD